ncbi:trypsin-like peptidase domain-containing protein (plasmid) [Deinococcus sp. KNUC1210]|uniref:S1C family serine protease n=1 Tax=Deinococcus sp. KNUC1210 TaxID=2917691 RepID=UPI001EF1255C|nr:trypsin-like peptidase domain-containing protein [Deinococcus sp. KNUC1210]ULH13866.1 trypsin-like peptidase domain-containing protein [Deinococcus sp. KNUC1210]
MNRPARNSQKVLLAASALLALGSAAFFGHTGWAAAQTAAPVTSSVPAFNATRARTENERNTVEVVKAAQDGLVYVSVQSGGRTSTVPRSGTMPGNSDPFAGTPFAGLPFGQGTVPGFQNQPQRGTGSGFFIDARGDILTNYHVVEGADTITIRVHNHPETYTAKVIGTAPDYDLAVIRADKLPTSLIKPIALGNSDGLEPGLKAVALGAPFDLDFSVTEGIISATARKIPVGVRGVSQSVIQTDAAINPGNSGGPLLDSAGRVIGINTQILTGGSEQNAGVGFAIPVNVAKALLPRLTAGDKIITPRLGISYANLSTLDSTALKTLHLPTQGALVMRVEAGSPAEKAGLHAGTQTVTLQDGTSLTLGGDIITQIDGQTVGQNNELQSVIFGRKVGDIVNLKVQRGDQTLNLSAKLTDFTPSATTTQRAQ